jgi:hypothetical protein
MIMVNDLHQRLGQMTVALAVLMYVTEAKSVS